MAFLSDFVHTLSVLPLDGVIDWTAARFQKYLQNPALMRDHAKLALVLAIIIAIEIAGRRDWRARYGSRNFRIDCFYYVFYYCGLYHILLWAWIYTALTQLVSEYAPWLQMNLMSGMSPVMQIITLIIAADFLGYWSHRMRHSNRYLWAFHTIHHSQTTLTAVTNYRFHIVDETVLRLWLFIPFQILGPGITMWLLVDFAMAWILLVQHSNFNWSYGRFGRIFVSPSFHRVHHSTEERLQNRNYAMLFSFWDDLFGTAERNAPIPAVHGLSGNPVPETLIGQITYPFTKLMQDYRHSAHDTIAPNPGAKSK